MPGPSRVELAISGTAALPDADYADAFRTASPAFFSAEDWARAALEGGSNQDVVAQHAAWRGVLQLRLGDLRDPDRIAGWEVVDLARARLVLGADSWHLVARLVFESTPGSARVTTLLRYRNPAGQVAWSALAPVHRRAVPRILDAARARLTR